MRLTALFFSRQIILVQYRATVVQNKDISVSPEENVPVCNSVMAYRGSHVGLLQTNIDVFSAYINNHSSIFMLHVYTGRMEVAAKLMIKTIPGMSICTVDEFYCLDNVISAVFSEQGAVLECWPGVAFNNERDQKLCQTQGSETPSVAAALHPSFGCILSPAY